MAFYLQTGKLILKDHSTITLINCVLMVGFVCVCVCVCILTPRSQNKNSSREFESRLLGHTTKTSEIEHIFVMWVFIVMKFDSSNLFAFFQIIEISPTKDGRGKREPTLPCSYAL